MSSVTAPNGALSVQSQNQPVQSAENCCQRAWRWIAETASCIWEAVMGFFRGLCCCGRSSTQQSSTAAQTTPTSASTSTPVLTATTTSASTAASIPTATTSAPSAPPQECDLPNGTVYFNPNANGEAAQNEQLGRQLKHPSVDRSGFTSAVDRECINDTRMRMQRVQGRLRVAAGFDTSVGSLVSRFNGEPALYIVVPYRDGIVEFLQRELPNANATQSHQWQVYTNGNRRFIGGYWQRMPRERSRSVELPPALVPYIPLVPSASSTAPATPSTPSTTNTAASPLPSGTVELNTDPAARADLNRQLIQHRTAGSPRDTQHSYRLVSSKAEITALFRFIRVEDARIAEEVLLLRRDMETVTFSINTINSQLPVQCLLSSVGDDPDTRAPAVFIVVPYLHEIDEVLPDLRSENHDDVDAREWRVYTVDRQKFYGWVHKIYPRNSVISLPEPLTVAHL